MLNIAERTQQNGKYGPPIVAIPVPPSIRRAATDGGRRLTSARPNAKDAGLLARPVEPWFGLLPDSSLALTGKTNSG
jgi:hypothetical protein